MKRTFEFLIVLFVLFFGLFNGKIVFAESYLDEDLLMEYSQNSIMFYDNCSSGGGGGAAELEGKDNMERVWNWFVNAGIDGVSDNPAVIAGILGNLGKESGYNPFAKNSSGYYGLYQEDSAEMRKYVEEKVGSVEWGSSTDDAEKNSAAIAAELEWLQKHSDFEQFVKNLDAPKNKDGVAGAKAYAELFLVRYERAVNGSDAIEDSGVADYMRKMYGGKTYLYQNASGRRDEAEKVYNYSQENGLGTKSGGSSSGDLPSCGGGDVKDSKNINATAVALAWPEGTPEKDYLYKQTNGKKGRVVYDKKLYSDLTKDSGGPTEAFKEAFDELFPNPNWNPCSKVGASCDVFAATVVGYSGYDKKFPRALEKILIHARNSDLWEVISFNGDKEKVKGGDLLIRSSGHIAVAVRDEDDKLWVAQASLCKHWGYISDASVKNYQFIVRATKANNSTAGISVKNGVANSNAAGKTTKKGQGNGDIAASAFELAWPLEDLDKAGKSATDKFANYYKKVNTDNTENGGKSCDCFAGTVIRYSGLDDDFPVCGGVPSMMDYVDKNDDWEKIEVEDPTKLDDYKSGDLVFYFKSGKDNPGHVGIYAEDSSGNPFDVSASQGERYGSTREPSFITNMNHHTGKRVIYRNKNNKNATVDCDVCAGDDDVGGGALKDGGFDTLEEAQEFMKAYREEARKRKKGSYSFSGAFVYDGGCNDGTLNNCSAFSEWFVNKYTTAGPNISAYQGADTVKNLLSLNKGFENGGKVPHAYAVFSSGPFEGQADGWWNHTGVVLGVNQEKNQMIIGDASCHNGFTDRYPGAAVVDLDKWTNSSSKYGPTYAYTDNILKGGLK